MRTCGNTKHSDANRQLADENPLLKGLGTLAFAALAGWGFFASASGSWGFALAEFAFLAWLAREIGRTDGGALARPALARECASTLALIGLMTLVLVPWLAYKLQFVPAILIGAQLFAVARLTKLVAPVHHEGAARKLSAPEEPGE